MRTVIAILMMASCAGWAADEGYNGRWDISMASAPGAKPRGYWLEIEGAGTPNAKGRFVSAYAGDMNNIDEISFSNGELRFGFRPKQRRRQGEEPRETHLVYTAKLVDGKLKGTFQVEGQSRPPVEWTGVRAPEINEQDDASWREARPVKLFNGKDLTGWHGIIPGRDSGWSVQNGSLTSFGKGIDLASDRAFWNFLLHVEYRIKEGSNSGIGLRARYEIQINDDYGRPPNGHTSGALYARVPASENASRKPGEWQTYDIRLVGRWVTLVFNGKKVLDKVHVDGLTAMAIDANEGEPGPISLQGDHGFVEFRDITLTPLVKK